MILLLEDLRRNPPVEAARTGRGESCDSTQAFFMASIHNVTTAPGILYDNSTLADYVYL